eukprot:gene19297-19694_t
MILNAPHRKRFGKTFDKRDSIAADRTLNLEQRTDRGFKQPVAASSWQRAIYGKPAAGIAAESRRLPLIAASGGARCLLLPHPASHHYRAGVSDYVWLLSLSLWRMRTGTSTLRPTPDARQCRAAKAYSARCVPMPWTRAAATFSAIERLTDEAEMRQPWSHPGQSVCYRHSGEVDDFSRGIDTVELPDGRRPAWSGNANWRLPSRPSVS